MGFLASYDIETYTVIKVDELVALRAEIARLRGIILKLTTEGDLGIPYARNPPNWHWQCMYCESDWAESTRERHTDDCPVTLARAALEDQCSNSQF
jgi:hypothetical protein